MSRPAGRPRRVRGNGTEQREQHGVAGHLQTELDSLLKRDCCQASDGTDANPVGRRVVFTGTKSFTHVP